MFTGIVSELGTVTEVAATPAGRRLTVHAPSSSAGMAVGDSIAVNGVCLNVGDRVDLERPMAASGRFDGHIVQGHVDGVGSVVSIAAEGEAWRIRIALPDSLAAYVVEKGSITVDGVSLTVTAAAEPGASPAWFEVVLIPHTLEVTVLGLREVGSRVNLEMDVIAKYIERLMEVRS